MRAHTPEDRAKVDLRFHFTDKTLNEVVSPAAALPLAVKPPHHEMPNYYQTTSRKVR